VPPCVARIHNYLSLDVKVRGAIRANILTALLSLVISDFLFRHLLSPLWVQAQTSEITHPTTVQPRKKLSTKIAAAFLWRIPTSAGIKYINMPKSHRTVRIDIPPAADGTIGVGEGIGVGNACNIGLINSNSINFFSFFQFVVRFVPVEIEALIADQLLSFPISLEDCAAAAACLSHFNSP
jgi:hypothetical protein